MNFYATVDTQGYLTAIYNAHDDFPINAVLLAEDEYAKIIASGEQPSLFKLVDGVATIDTAMELDSAKAVKIEEIKTLAGKKILRILPEWKQRNLIYRATELTGKKTDGATLTADEQAELDTIKLLWDSVTSIRDASNAIESEINASATPETYDVASSLLWP